MRSISGCKVTERLYISGVAPGEISGEPGQATRVPKRGRKGRGPLPESVTGSLDRLALLRAANQALLGAAALAADAARLLRWGAAGGDTADAACTLAGDLVQWTCQLAATAEEGAALTAAPNVSFHDFYILQKPSCNLERYSVPADCSCWCLLHVTLLGFFC